MRPASILTSGFTFAVTLLMVLTFSSNARAQNNQSGTQDASPPACGAAAGATTAQSGSTSQSSSSLSNSTKNLETAAKQLGSIFKKKPAASSTAAAPSPCPPPTSNAGGTEPAPSSGASSANSTAATAASPSAGQQAPAPGSALGSVQLPPAPPGGLDPAKLPDIVGIHIGTPTDKVIAQLNSLYPLVRNERGTELFGPGGGNGNGVGVGYIKYAPTNDPPFVSSAMYTRPFPEGCSPRGCQSRDEIMAIFSGPPEKRLVRLERTLSWDGDNQTTSDNLKAALIQKYGASFVEYPQHPPVILKWAFDEEGNALPAPKPNVTCTGLVSQQGYPAPNVYSLPNYIGFPSEPVTQQQLTTFMRGRCPYISVQAQINGRPGGTANQMTVIIEELPQDLRNTFAAEQYIRRAANAQANQQLKKAQQQEAPKF